MPVEDRLRRRLGDARFDDLAEQGATLDRDDAIEHGLAAMNAVMPR